MLPLDRREFIAALGGTAAVGLMSHEARADALEDALLARSEGGMAMAAAQAAAATPAAAAPQPYPTVAQLEAQVPDLPRRRGTGAIFFNSQAGGKLPLLPKMPAKPTLVDFFECLRRGRPGEHRAIRRHHRPAFQAAQGRTGQRQQPVRPYVAHAGQP
jgi:hypothetical protein